MDRFVLLIKCSDQKGLVYKITKILYEANLNIEKNDEFVDKENNKFFMRTDFFGVPNSDELLSKLSEILPNDAEVALNPRDKKNILLMATKESHCLGDLLIRYHSGELNANILGVIANHTLLEPLVSKFDLPFFHISAECISREEHEHLVLDKISSINPDLIVLAKYMRILSSSFVRHFPQKIVNIHHSFLPAFIGANPYKQAYERGVKIIGATAHFVNENLDEGPIIEQDIAHIDHSYNWLDMQKAGRDIEKVVLSRALNLVLEDRIFVHGNKTVIF